MIYLIQDAYVDKNDNFHKILKIEELLESGFYIKNSGKIQGNLSSLKSHIILLDKDKIIRDIILFLNMFQNKKTKSIEINKIIEDFYLDL